MMRKKNITLNGKKCQGSEILAQGDEVCLFLAEETIRKFSGPMPEGAGVREPGRTSKGGESLDIIYEDATILLVNKPAGMLSQKAKEGDYSLNERIFDYLIRAGHLPRRICGLSTPRSAIAWTGTPAVWWLPAYPGRPSGHEPGL